MGKERKTYRCHRACLKKSLSMFVCTLNIHVIHVASRGKGLQRDCIQLKYEAKVGLSDRLCLTEARHFLLK